MLRRVVVLLGVALMAGGSASASALADVDLNLVKERADGGGTVPVGGVADFTLTVSNLLDGSVAHRVTVTDTFPAGLTPVDVQAPCAAVGQVVTCSLGAPLGDFDEPSFLVRARAEPAAAASVVVNRAEATADEADIDTDNNQDSLDLPVGPYSVLAATMAASPGSVVAGSSVTFTATIHNDGPSPADGVRLVDLLENGLLLRSVTPTQGACAALACDLGTIPAGGAARVEVVADADVSVSGRRVSRVEATATSPSSSAHAEAAVDVTSRSVTGGGRPDLVVTVRPPARAREGVTGTWALEVVNRGPGAASGVRVRGASTPAAVLVGARGAPGGCGARLPVTCDLGALAAGERRVVALRLRPRARGRLAVTGSVAAAEGETTNANNLRRATREVDAGRARLTLRARALTARLRPGERVRVLITVGNPSHVAVRRLEVCARPPGARRTCWTLAAMRPGGSQTYRVAGTAQGPGVAATTATARAANAAPAAARATVRVVSP